MNDACILLAEEMTGWWLNPILQASQQPCVSPTCGAYRDPGTHPAPLQCQWRCGGVSTAGGKILICVINSPFLPYFAPPPTHKSQQLFAVPQLPTQLRRRPLTFLWPCCQTLPRSLHTSPAGIWTSKTPVSIWSVFITRSCATGSVEVGVSFLHWFWSPLNAVVIRQTGHGWNSGVNMVPWIWFNSVKKKKKEKSVSQVFFHGEKRLSACPKPLLWWHYLQL